MRAEVVALGRASSSSAPATFFVVDKQHSSPNRRGYDDAFEKTLG